MRLSCSTVAHLWWLGNLFNWTNLVNFEFVGTWVRVLLLEFIII